MIKETIVALSSGSDPAALAVVRLSGPESFAIVKELTKGKNVAKWQSHTLHFVNIYDADGLLDEAVIGIFKAPNTFTKEDIVEISCHGSAFIVERLISTCINLGARLAEPGEFTLRAYLNGRLDLSQAEAVADLISADNAGAHRLALEHLRGGFSEMIDQLREKLINFASYLELELDFSQEDVEFVDRTELISLLNDIIKQVQILLGSFKQGNALKTGIPVAIVGPPNAGKSTLLNTLLNEEKAIVTHIPGTTRDVIEDSLFIKGIKFRILDTAGIRNTTDLVEAMGIARSKKAIADAHIVLIMYELSTPESEIQDLIQLAEKAEAQIVFIRNKADLDQEATTKKAGEIQISAANKTGIQEIENALLQFANAQLSGNIMLTNLRHVQHLEETSKALHLTLVGIDQQLPTDLLAQHIRQALHHLGMLTGTISTDDLLGNIFSKFCIGK